MNYFSPIFGIVTNNDPQSENGGSFLSYFYTLKKMAGEPVGQDEKFIYHDKMHGAYMEKGLYRRSSYHDKTRVSQDEISGFIFGSKQLDTFHAKDVMDYLKENKGNYHATGEDRFYSQGDYYSWDLAVYSKSSKFRAIWYSLNLLISSNKPKENTSSKMIYLNELYNIKDISPHAKRLWNYYVWRMNKMYGANWIASLYSIYFHTENSDHPLLVMANKVKGVL